MNTPDPAPAIHFVMEFEVDSPMVEHVQIDLLRQDEDERDLPPLRLWLSVDQARELIGALQTYTEG
jgi:hypothetical protein